MGILSDLLTGPIGEVGYGAMAESYERANKKADDQAALFRGLGVDLRAERIANEKDLNQKLSNFRSVELDFLSNAKKYGDYGDLSQEDLKLKFAPMANFLKGDTFAGKPEDVQKKVAEALYQSGGYKEGDPYTSVEEFTNQTKSAINKGLETYSGLAWNTWDNQVGSLAYKTPDYNPTKEIGKELIFSGYPGRQSLRTVRALIAGVEGKRFVMQSTAWKGSSGSCVFDSDGNFVGVVFALSMSQFEGRPVLLESMIWVEPYTSINWDAAKKFVKALN